MVYMNRRRFADEKGLLLVNHVWHIGVLLLVYRSLLMRVPSRHYIQKSNALREHPVIVDAVVSTHTEINSFVELTSFITVVI